jgi:hypothetical protein
MTSLRQFIATERLTSMVVYSWKRPNAFLRLGWKANSQVGFLKKFTAPILDSDEVDLTVQFKSQEQVTPPTRQCSNGIDLASFNWKTNQYQNT